MKAVLWNYRYPDMKETWSTQLNWVVNSLRKYGVVVTKHINLKCAGLEAIEPYNSQRDNPADICIYNHADVSHLTGNVLQTKVNWFFKPTVPDKYYTTLDELGYGPYSSITYNKPELSTISNEEVITFFDTKVASWIEQRTTKWGKYYTPIDIELQDKDYILILGQCFGDEVVTRHDFGNYYSKLEAVVKETSSITNKKVIIKLHPYTDGLNAKNTNFSEQVKEKLQALNNNIVVYLGKSNVHTFIKNSSCVILANSGSGFEAMMHHKPIIAWGYPEYHWITYDLRHLADLKNALSLRWFNSNEQDRFLYWYLEKYCFYNQETCDVRVAKLLQNIK